MAAASDFYYVRSDQMPTIGGSVSGGADTGYLDEWLVDGRPGRPARAATGSQTWTITISSSTVGIAAICNHNIDAARTITLGGGISASTSGPTLPANGIPLNPWVTFGPTGSVTSITVAVSSNTNPLIIGEFVCGTRSTLERSLRPGASITTEYDVVRHDAEFNSLMPYDKGIVRRTLRGGNIYTDSGLAAILDWYDSTRGGTKPTLIVPYSTVQDAWLVEMKPPQYQHLSNNRNEVSFEFVEYPRSRW